jgi:hypothetical protein
VICTYSCVGDQFVIQSESAARESYFDAHLSVTYQSRYILLQDAIALIARRLEAKIEGGSPNLIARAIEDFSQGIAHSVRQALEMMWASPKNEAPRLAAPRSHLEEAEQQLNAAVADGIIVAIGDFQVASTEAPITKDVPAAAFSNPNGRRDGNTMVMPWGQYGNARFKRNDLDRVWPVADPSIEAWMLTYARRATTKIKRSATIMLCMEQTGATWRQAEKAFRALPSEYVNQRGRPRRGT